MLHRLYRMDCLVFATDPEETQSAWTGKITELRGHPALKDMSVLQTQPQYLENILKFPLHILLINNYRSKENMSHWLQVFWDQMKYKFPSMVKSLLLFILIVYWLIEFSLFRYWAGSIPSSCIVMICFSHKYGSFCAQLNWKKCSLDELV